MVIPTNYPDEPVFLWQFLDRLLFSQVLTTHNALVCFIRARRRGSSIRVCPGFSLMASQSQDERPRQRFEILRRAEQPFLVMVVGLAVVFILAYWTMRYVNRDRLIEIDRAAPLNAEFKVDINTAPWPENTCRQL